MFSINAVIIRDHLSSEGFFYIIINLNTSTVSLTPWPEMMT